MRDTAYSHSPCLKSVPCSPEVQELTLTLLKNQGLISEKKNEFFTLATPAGQSGRVCMVGQLNDILTEHSDSACPDLAHQSILVIF